MRRLYQILGFSVLVMYFPVMLAFVSVDRDGVLCREVRSEINDSVVNRFITADEIRILTLEKYPGILGRLTDDINAEEMELFFEKHPAINNCEVYSTLGGVLHIEIDQKVPVLRVFDGVGKSYYLDREGEKMPLSLKHTAHVLVANGHINKLKNSGDLFDLAQFINGDLFWRSQIEQIYVDTKGEFVLAPRVGDHLIEFGTIENMRVKFRNLKALYRNGWDAREWNIYRKVSLKYNGQIVCSKVN
jgi:cell division protein FtsQ